MGASRQPDSRRLRILGFHHAAALPECINSRGQRTPGSVQARSGPGHHRYPGRGRHIEFEGACEYDDLHVDVETAFEIIAARGPKAGTSRVVIVFFAAIISPDGQVIAKETFESRVEFPQNRRRVGVREQVTQKIPLTAQVAGQDYQILVGFQLTPDQLEYNQSRRR